MRKFVLFAVLVLSLALSACARLASKMAGLSPGMTKEEVIKTVGKPNGVMYKDGVEHLYYMMTEWAFDEPVRYDVVLVNGEVVSYGKDSSTDW